MKDKLKIDQNLRIYDWMIENDVIKLNAACWNDWMNKWQDERQTNQELIY